jgi:hypothetical protein
MANATIGGGSGALRALRLAPLVALLAAITSPSCRDSAWRDSRANSGGAQGKEGRAAGNCRNGAAGQCIEASAIHRMLLGPLKRETTISAGKVAVATPSRTDRTCNRLGVAAPASAKRGSVGREDGCPMFPFEIRTQPLYLDG